jgi:uncharacterized DUF497 family protein
MEGSVSIVRRTGHCIGSFAERYWVGIRRCCSYNNLLGITYDPAKRAKTLAERGLDFEDAALCLQVSRSRLRISAKDYGETRIICFGLPEGRMVVEGYVPRGEDRHIFSMRKANAREQARLAPYLKV